ncbi:type II toxin-antitoxin system Phd/YefM family antitoxin [Deinococcus sp.]|uniref:type II toxin-antitoxin system Phd/YefM family antitoxin n=1 Tax=Deinococcus sp. TaxID=47478 RepID=UPI003B5B9662
MKTVDIHEAVAQFSDLVDAASRGEEIVLIRDGEPLAKLVGLPQGERPLGFHPIEFRSDLAAPTDDDVLGDFEGI